ncbi:Na+/H+ antiporter subunit A [Paenibacillus beijingensis]|uniref:Monovalent cation/H+ antiporter subunit A n=1 Tax=Paenibacillus beijingensis TaxID=1126833 RepID=A0A0D5NEZ4_9BACL|nr:Na+/H+ antiporter subunit A [Paenibacillus beijingensis]AJY73959.1 monovalent cation/H+ antiporter subunit A [Paenibacillus beijingensis]
MSLLHVAIIVPFLLASAVPLLGRLLRRVHAGWLVLPGPAVLFGYFVSRIPFVRQGGEFASLPWMPSLGIDFTVQLDGLSLLFALLISGIGSLVVLYSIFYLDKNKEQVRTFYVYLLLFMGAMLGVVLSDNMMVLYGFWELTSISSFLLIAFWHHRERSRYGALKSMLITVFGGLAMLAGFILLYVMSGTFSIRGIIDQAGTLAAHELFIPAMLLILLGAFTKSAQFPFHIWLPDAMEAPTPVSAYLHSATMVKAGLYLVARFNPFFAGAAEWFWLVSGFGLMTLIYGSFRALKQTDLKAMLAFSTVSQLGLIMSLLGLGSAAASAAGAEALLYTGAVTAAVFHIVNHAAFKGALFMVADIVDHETGTRDIRKLGGLLPLMPVTFTIALFGTFSMAGLPPFGGYLSKEMFLMAVLDTLHMDVWNAQTWSVLIPAVAWMASVFTFVYSMILLFRTFTGPLQPDKLERKPHEAPLGMLIPPAVLGLLALVFGLFPNLLSHSLIEPAIAAIVPRTLPADEHLAVHIAFWHGWTPEVFMTAGIIAAGIVLYKLHRWFKPLREPLFTRISLNRAYDWSLSTAERGAARLTGAYMTGSVRDYLSYIFVFFIAALGITMFLSGSLRIDMSQYAPLSLYEAVIIAVLIVSAAAVPFARSRLMAIIWTGAAGYMVTLFFVLFRAPDLALTQMIVETVSVTLFLLCFYHLPKLKREVSALRFKLTNFLIATGVGAVVTLIALGASGSPTFGSISEFFLQESYHSAGGKNVVNVILVDFRGFDTLLEITVLGIASLGIYALIKLSLDPDDAAGGSRLRTGRREPHAVRMKGKRRPDIHLPASNDVILRTVSKAVIFLILTFALYLFFSGHHEPGGGFIAALLTSSALVLLSMAFGMNTMEQVIPVDFRSLTAAGLMIALLTGIGSFLFDAPFLSHAFGYFDLPLLGRTELATAVLFDLGVYLSVVGVTMTIIFTIGRDI